MNAYGTKDITAGGTKTSDMCVHGPFDSCIFAIVLLLSPRAVFSLFQLKNRLIQRRIGGKIPVKMHVLG